jgi:uncharacterized cupredoxin-like copper-binding protein
MAVSRRALKEEILLREGDRVQMKRIILLGLIILPLAFVACASGGTAETAPEPKAVTLIATDIAYDIEQIDVSAGQTVELTLDNQGVLEHDFTIVEIPLADEVTTIEEAGEMEAHDAEHAAEENDVHIAAPTADQGTIAFTPAAPGEYVYYCTVSGHREAGMEGVLIVE